MVSGLARGIRSQLAWQTSRRSFQSSSSVAQPAGAFEARLAATRLLIVAGAVPGRASVSAAASLLLARRGPTLLVDANDPAHRLGDVIGTGLLPTEPSFLKVEGELRSVLTARLSVDDTHAFLQEMQAMEKWQDLLQKDAGGRLASTLGVPRDEFLNLLTCFRPPPGAEIPVALARLLRNHPEANRAAHIVVDAGPVSDAAKLQDMPQAIAETLRGVVRLHGLIEAIKQNTSPFAMAGISFMLGDLHENLVKQLQTTMSHLEEIQAGMESLAALEQGTLLVLPHVPGDAGISGNQRLVQRLKPTCIALAGAEEADEAASWLPADIESIILPWGREVPVGLDEISKLAGAMRA